MKKYVYILLYLIIGQLYIFAIPAIGIWYETQGFNGFKFISENELQILTEPFQSKIFEDGTYHYELSYERDCRIFSSAVTV